MKKIILAAALMLTFFPRHIHAQEQQPVGIVEKLGQTVPLDAEFYDENGNLVQLKSVITKPAIVMFVYYRCPGICNPLMTEVAKIVQKMDLELGKDYQIVTISFDPEEKPELAADKKDNYLSLIKRKVDPNGWRFFTGDSVNIHRMTDAAGFFYKKENGTWVHAGVLIAVSPNGKIARYLYGIQHLPLDVKLALMEAAEGRTGPTIAKILSFCYAYDPEGQRYALDIVRICGVVFLGLVGVFIMVFLVKPGKKKGGPQ
jgi:protein SCO1/2